MTSSTAGAKETVEPPNGWTADEAQLSRKYYWTTDSNSLKSTLETHYVLTAVNPIWVRKPKYGVLFIFEGQPSGIKEKRYYAWNGYGDRVAQFEQTNLKDIRDAINLHGGKEGYLDGVKLKQL